MKKPTVSFGKLEITTSREDLHQVFADQLEDLFGKCFVVRDFPYKGLILDFAVISTDRLIEVCHVTTKEEYVRQLATIGRAGPVSFNKHKSIQQGKFISNAFYFLTPARTLTAAELPPKYGLITYTEKNTTMNFAREADFISPDEYLTKSFYKTVATFLAKKKQPHK